MQKQSTHPPPGGPSGRPGGVLPWLKLLLGLCVILFFMFGIGSLSKYIPGAKRMAQVIDERGLRATAVWYTDFDESAEGSEDIRNSLDYPPGVK